MSIPNNSPRNQCLRKLRSFGCKRSLLSDRIPHARSSWRHLWACVRFYPLVYAEIMCYVSIAGKPVSSVKVARQGGDVIVLSGCEARFVSCAERDDGSGIFYPVHHRLPLRVGMQDRQAAEVGTNQREYKAFPWFLA